MTTTARYLALALLAGLLLGCRAAPLASQARGTPAQAVPPTLGVVASPTPRATSPSAILALPPGMPVYPGAGAVQADDGAIAAWSSDADPPAVYDFFLGALPAAGFTVEAALPGGDAAIIRFSIADGGAYQLDLTGHAPVSIVLGPPHD